MSFSTLNPLLCFFLVFLESAIWIKSDLSSVINSLFYSGNSFLIWGYSLNLNSYPANLWNLTTQVWLNSCQQLSRPYPLPNYRLSCLFEPSIHFCVFFLVFLESTIWIKSDLSSVINSLLYSGNSFLIWSRRPHASSNSDKIFPHKFHLQSWVNSRRV